MRRHPIASLASILIALSLAYCSTDRKKGGGGDNDDDGGGASGSVDAGSTLNGSISGSYDLENPATDESIGVSSNQSGPGEAHPGTTVNVSLSFEAPNGDVIGAGIRFGESGPIHVIEIPEAQGQLSGTLNFAVQIPASVCDSLSSICHDIKCYEFAVTAAGTISKANINSLALACGNCDEPSCQDLLQSCNEDPDPCAACTADQICIDGQCQEATAANSCALREPSCCPGQDNSCTAPDAVCFCDAFCVEAGDCCPDACGTCGYCG